MDQLFNKDFLDFIDAFNGQCVKLCQQPLLG
jgi:hypothetical protein